MAPPVKKAAFELASLIALLKDDISSNAYGVLRQVREHTSDIRFHRRPLHPHRLSLMGFKLHGVVLFSAEGDAGMIQAAVEALAPDARASWLDWSSVLSTMSPGLDLDKFKLLQAFSPMARPGSAKRCCASRTSTGKAA